MYVFDVYTTYKLMGILGNMTHRIYFRNNLTSGSISSQLAVQLVMTDVYTCNCLQLHNTIHLIWKSRVDKIAWFKYTNHLNPVSTIMKQQQL